MGQNRQSDRLTRLQVHSFSNSISPQFSRDYGKFIVKIAGFHLNSGFFRYNKPDSSDNHHINIFIWIVIKCIQKFGWSAESSNLENLKESLEISKAKASAG